MVNKTWATYGLFEKYEAAKHQLLQLEATGVYDLYKIKKVKEIKKRGWYKLKVWKKPVEIKKKNKKSQKKLAKRQKQHDD